MVPYQKEKPLGKGQRGQSALFSREPLAVSALRHRDVPDTSKTKSQSSRKGSCALYSYDFFILSFFETGVSCIPAWPHTRYLAKVKHKLLIFLPFASKVLGSQVWLTTPSFI